MKQRKEILFITPSMSSFNKNDIAMLTNNFNVKVQHYDWSNKILVPVLILRQFLDCLLKIHKIDICIISFAGLWSPIPTLLFKFTNVKTVIILHGTESANIPSLGYGNLRKNYLKTIIKFSLNNANLLLPVSNSILNTENSWLPENEQKQGVLVHFPDLKTPYKVIPNGVELDKWNNNILEERKENSFLAVISEGQYFLKGGDLIFQLASQKPKLNFTIVGMNAPSGIVIPSNLHFLGIKKQSELKKIYYNHQFYFQLSLWEGFGLSLCEAMYCGCIPIGSSSNVISDIIHDTGYIIEERSVNKLIDLIQNLPNYNPEKGELAKKRIAYKFPLEKRKQEFIKVLSR